MGTLKFNLYFYSKFMQQSIKNWLGGPNKNTFDNHRIINLMLLDNSKYIDIKKKYSKFNSNKFKTTDDKFNYLLSIKDLHERYYVGMLFYGFEPEKELKNILDYIHSNQNIPDYIHSKEDTCFKLYRGECRNSFEIDNIIKSKNIIEFKNIISTTPNKEYAMKFLKSNIKSGQSGDTMVMFVFKNIKAAYLKLSKDAETTYRVWCNNNDPNDKNFMNYDECIKENVGDEYLILPGEFVVEKYKYFSNGNVAIHLKYNDQ